MLRAFSQWSTPWIMKANEHQRLKTRLETAYRICSEVYSWGLAVSSSLGKSIHPYQEFHKNPVDIPKPSVVPTLDLRLKWNMVEIMWTTRCTRMKSNSTTTGTHLDHHGFDRAWSFWSTHWIGVRYGHTAHVAWDRPVGLPWAREDQWLNSTGQRNHWELLVHLPTLGWQ